MWLGGDDFDHKIMALVVEHVKTMYEIDARKNAHFMGKLRQEAEKAKKILSSLNQAEIVIPSLLKDSEGNLIDLEMEISREQLEGMIRERVNESINLVKEAMVQAQVTADQIDHILLVGGSSSIPLVRRSLAALFGEAKIMMNVDPMKCVAYGAARLSATLGEQVECSRGHANPGTAERRSECGDLLTQDRIVVRCSRGHVNPGTAERCSECGELLHIDVGRVTGQDYGIQAKGDVFEIIIKQGTSFPTREPVIRRFVTPAANLRRIKAPVYAGTNKVATKNELQITVWLELPEHLPESTPVDVSLSLDENGSFERVKASLKDGSGREVEAYPDRGSDKRSRLEKKIEQAQRKWQEKREQVDDNEQIEKVYSQVIKAANANQVEDAEKLLEQMRKLMPPEGWVERAKGILNYSDAMLGMYGWLIEEPQKSEIKKAMGDLSEAIAAEDEKRAEERFKRLDKLTDEVPPPVISLMIVTRAIIRARRLEMVVEADQLTTGRQSMVDALRAHDFAHGSRILAEIWPTVEKVLGRRGESGKLGEDLLEVASPGAEAKR
jgi:molecular chaperone DnaK (HSP70)